MDWRIVNGLTFAEREAVERKRFTRYLAEKRQLGIGAKRLVLDIENEKSTYARYGTGEQYVSGKDLVTPGKINGISFGWLDEDDIKVFSIYKQGYEAMIREAHRVLTEAEYVIGHNFKRHDRGKLNEAFALLGLNFPEYVVVDTLHQMRKAFGSTLPSGNALKEASAHLGIGTAVDHYYLIYDDLQAGDASAIRRFHEYSEHDITLTKSLYNFLVEKTTGKVQ